MGTSAPDTPIRPAAAPVESGSRRARPILDARLIGRVRPISAPQDQLLPVLPALAPLLPDRGLRRGTVVVVRRAGPAEGIGPRPTDGTGPRRTGGTAPQQRGAPRGGGGTTTLALSLLAGASGSGSWCAIVGVPDAGLVAMAELGLDLDRLAVVPMPGPHWPEVSAVLFDGMDIVLIRPVGTVRPGVARRLTARVRERRVVLVVLSDRGRWPDGADIRMAAAGGEWQGVDLGHGHLQGRRAEVAAVGRRGAVRPARTGLWLPGPAGAVMDG